MAGYIMTIGGDFNTIKRCFSNGVYSTYIPVLDKSGNVKKNWNTAQEGTFADYFSMKAGDNIYFFSGRKIYGIGELIDIKGDCKYLNYEDALTLTSYGEFEFRQKDKLVDEYVADNRCICIFKPSPYFFADGIDMDDALTSNPAAFRMLRVLWKLSFIKIDDEENKALKDILLKRNEDILETGEGTIPLDDKLHKEIEAKLSRKYRLSAYNLLLNTKIEGNRIGHEMAIEAALCDMLGKDNDSPFGKWDYISHQVAGSPFKPVDYMDKMDIFGYRYIKGYQTISKYLLMELKKDEATEEVIEQVMKYVDWINQEYTHGDYSMIDAFVLAYDFPEAVIEKKRREGLRNFTKGFRPSKACVWNNLRLIKYSYENGELKFEEVL